MPPLLDTLSLALLFPKNQPVRWAVVHLSPGVEDVIPWNMTNENTPVLTFEEAAAWVESQAPIRARTGSVDYKRRLVEVALAYAWQGLSDVARKSPGPSSPDLSHPDTLVSMRIRASTQLSNLSEFGSSLGMVAQLTGKTRFVELCLTGPAREAIGIGQSSANISLVVPADKMGWPKALSDVFTNGELAAAIGAFFPATDGVLQSAGEPSWDTWAIALERWATLEPSQAHALETWKAQWKERQLEEAWSPVNDSPGRRPPRL